MRVLDDTQPNWRERKITVELTGEEVLYLAVLTDRTADVLPEKLDLSPDTDEGLWDGFRSAVGALEIPMGELVDRIDLFKASVSYTPIGEGE